MSLGVKKEHCISLHLPFYETGTIKKGEPDEKDFSIVRNLLLKIKPDMIFAAGDLTDPHGTHRVCLNIILKVIEDI